MFVRYKNRSRIKMTVVQKKKDQDAEITIHVLITNTSQGRG